MDTKLYNYLLFLNVLANTMSPHSITHTYVNEDGATMQVVHHQGCVGEIEPANLMVDMRTNMVQVHECLHAISCMGAP